MKILFIQGIHNFSLKEQFVADVSTATGYEVLYFPMDYGLFEAPTHLELINKINRVIQKDDDRFIILAHSFGGILAHSLEEKTYAKVDKLITFATPHGLPRALLARLITHLPYAPKLPVPIQRSCGFYMDFTVPFPFTRNKHVGSHKNYIGTHTQVMNRRSFFKKLIHE